MALNFMGLGFSFGAKDAGLDDALGGVNDKFKQLNDSIKDFQVNAAEGLSPAEGMFEDITDQLDDLMVGEDKWSFKDLDLDLPTDPKDQVDDLSNAMGSMAEGAALGGTKFGRMANSVLGGAGKITGALGWVGMAIGPVISGFGQAAETAGNMIDTVAGIPGRVSDQIHRLANDGINLTNSLEGEAVALGQTARSVGVNMGYTGANLRRFIGQATGMAMGLNIGADEAARAIRAWDESAETLGATGLSSAQDVARLTAALGINADVLRNSTLELRNLGAEDEQIHLVTSALAQMGRETGDVSGALNELPQVLQMLERRRALGDTPEQMAAFAADTAAAARGLFEFTQDSERARQMASELAGTVTESREAFQNMFAGTEDQLPQLATELAITTGDVQRSFQMMREGPGGLIQGIGELVQQTGGQGERFERLMGFMRGRLQQVFGPEMTGTLVNFWRTMDSETVGAMQAIRGASVDLGEMGREAHTTGRTLDEVFERMRAGFQTAFRRIARPAVRDFVRDTGRQLRRLRRSMNAAAADSGALGTVMEQLSLASQIGGLALLPEELRGTAIAADELQGMVTPLIQAFGTWGGLVETVGAYIALFATEVIMAREEVGSWGEAIDRTADRFAGMFVEWLDEAERFLVQFAEGFATFDWDALFGRAGEDGEGGPLGRVLQRLEQVDWARIWAGISTGLDRLFERVRPWLEEKMVMLREVVWDRLGEWWSAIDWSAVFSAIGDLAGGLWEAIQPALSTLGDMIGQWLSDHWMEIVMYGAIALTVAMAALIVLGVAALIAAVVALAGLIVAVVMSPFITVGVELAVWGDEIGQFFHAMWIDFTDWIEEFGEDFDDMLLEWDASFRRAWRGMARWFESLWDGITNSFERVWEHLTGVFNQAVEDWQTVFAAIGEFFTGIGTGIRETVGAAIAFIQDRWNTFREGLSGIWEGLSEGWTTFLERGEEFWTALTGLPDRIREGWQGMVDFFRTMFNSIREVVGEDLAQVGQFFRDVGDIGARALDFITQRAEERHGHSLHTIIGADLEQVVEVMTSMANQVSEIMQTVLHDATVQAIVSGFQMGFATVVENMGEFSSSMVDSFTEMAEGISEIMTTLFTTVLSQAEMTMLGTETAVEGIIGRLRTITAAQAQLAEARGSALAALSRPEDEAALRRRLAQIRGSEVLRAIHAPAWYMGEGAQGRGGYRSLFVRKMDELSAAIRGLGIGADQGALERRRQLIREARGGVETAGSRVGGHPGTPGGPARG